MIKDDKRNRLNLKLLNSNIKSGNIPNSFLFTGNNSSGLLDLALHFAASLLCSEGGCFKCNVCKSVLNKSHQDLFILEPVGQTILVEDIKELRRVMNIKSSNGENYRISIISEFDLIKTDTSDRILKLLEDPPDKNCVFILLTKNVNVIKDTVRSRCQIYDWYFNLDYSTDFLNKLEIVKSETEELLDKIIRKNAGIFEVLEFSSKINEMIGKLSFEIHENQSREIENFKKVGFGKEETETLLKRIKKNHDRENFKFSNLIIAHVFDIISDYIEDILLIISGAEKNFVKRENNYSVIFNNYNSINSDANANHLLKLLDVIYENKKLLSERINYEIALDRVLIELVYI